jgi:YEATS domain-containing protein 4
VRVIDAPPFEVTEQGWGEFVIGITVQFRDGSLRQMDLQHNLRLFPDAQQQRDLPIERRRPVVAERYDEFVFVDPRCVASPRLASIRINISMSADGDL